MLYFQGSFVEIASQLGAEYVIVRLNPIGQIMVRRIVAYISVHEQIIKTFVQRLVQCNVSEGAGLRARIGVVDAQKEGLLFFLPLDEFEDVFDLIAALLECLVAGKLVFLQECADPLIAFGCRVAQKFGRQQSFGINVAVLGKELDGAADDGTIADFNALNRES